MTNARLAAARLLMEIERGRTTLGSEVERAREGVEDRRDRGLLLELAAGTLRWRGELDALIVHASRRSVARLEVAARTVLRMGAYQLRHLARVPAHAIVNESVEVVRALGAPHAAGLVNAVLRAIDRGPASGVVLPSRPDDTSDRSTALRYLSTTLSHPEWLVDRWLDRHSFEEVERWCTFNNAAPDITVRPLEGARADDFAEWFSREGVDARPAPFAAGAWRLPPGQLGRLSRDLREHLFVQDEGAQLVAHFAGVVPGERVLDVCAAPGGKSLVLARHLGLPGHQSSLLVAGDLRAARLSVLRQTVTRSGLARRVVAHDVSRALPFRSVFDCVLLDVPCSGLGTLRRDPDLKWRRSQADVLELAEKEEQMIGIAAEAVRPGGRLVYATCSSEPEENIDVVQGFLVRDRRFSLARSPAQDRLDSTLIDELGCLRTTPYRHGLDAFFAAVLVRRPDA